MYLPFMIIIIIGLIVVLVFQLWSYIAERNQVLTENKAATTIAAGSAEIMVWGDKEWVRGYDGTLLREGDIMRTSPNALVSLALLNGSFVRLGGDTEVVISSLESRDNQDSVDLLLKRGDIWLKRTELQGVDADFNVITENLTVRSTGTVFAVSEKEETSVRVLQGNVLVDIKSVENGKERVIEQVPVGVGQEISVGDRELALFKQRRNPTIHYILSDDFRESSWYSWNRKQDEEPVDAVTVKEAV